VRIVERGLEELIDWKQEIRAYTYEDERWDIWVFKRSES